jgi:hypothetical protein
LNNLDAKQVSDIKEILWGIEKQTGYIQAPECNVAIAAAEVIAAAKGVPPSDAPSEIAAWLKEKRPAVVAKLADSALKAAGRIKADSELKDLWDDAGRLQEWQDRVEDLLQRLTRKT